ncbi:Uncharacterized protein Adt_02626 [Abeliophyllum distichum]|uniref:Uncharacterized protein n=1 Tax=Abeliophyllum distichum TaxID=126358 RepID=A0ABD1VW98_9LAMI
MLAGWKAEQLSMAGSTLLVQSVTFDIPVYTMQATRIPEAINQEIDRRNCRFSSQLVEVEEISPTAERQSRSLGCSCDRPYLAFTSNEGGAFYLDPLQCRASILVSLFIEELTTNKLSSFSSQAGAYRYRNEPVLANALPNCTSSSLCKWKEIDVTYALEAYSTSSSEEGKQSSSINPLCFADSDVIISSGLNAHLG